MLGFEIVDKEIMDLCSVCECISFFVERVRYIFFFLYIVGCEGKVFEIEIRGGVVLNLGFEIIELREKVINEVRS